MHLPPEHAAPPPVHRLDGHILFAPLRVLTKRKPLIRALVRRDLESAFRGTVLGWLWVILAPLFMLAVYTFAFGIVFGAQWRDREPAPFLFPMLYFAGLLLFGLFTTSLSRAPNLMRDNATYIRQIVFPVQIFVPVVLGSELVKFAIGLAILLVAYLLLMGVPPLAALSYPVPLIGLVLFSAGISWAVSAVSVFVRDLGQAMQPATMVLLFLSPLFYPLSVVPEPIRWLFYLNPLAFPLEATRNALFFGEWPSLTGSLIYLFAGWLCAVAGLAFFQRLRPGFADVL